MKNKNAQKRILLIRPYFEMLEHELVFLPFEPLGLQYLMSALLGVGHQVKLYDCLAEEPRNIKPIVGKDLLHCGSGREKIIKIIKDFRPEIIGISGMFYAQSGPFNEIAKLIKEISEDIFIVGGGAFPSSYQVQALMANKNLDAIILGEGENIVVDLVNNLNNLSKVSGLCWRDRSTGQIHRNEPARPPVDLDKLNMPYRDFGKLYNYSKPVGYNYSKKFNLVKIIKSAILYGALSVPVVRFCFSRFFNWRHRHQPKAVFMPAAFMITSRGCPNRCTFCAIHKVWGNTYRMRSAENVLAEMDILAKRGVKEIVIVDDNFTASRSRTIAICQGIIARGYKLRIMTPSGVFIPSLDKEVLQYLYQAGLRELQFGVENGDQEFLDKVIKKNLSLDKVKEVVAQAKEVGLLTRGFFMFGYPGETRQTMLKTLRFAFESGMDAARFYIFQPLPGTEAHQMAQDLGAIDQELDFAKLRMRPNASVIETKDFSKEDVLKIFNLSYDILKKRNYNEIKNKIPNLLGWSV